MARNRIRNGWTRTNTDKERKEQSSALISPSNLRSSVANTFMLFLAIETSCDETAAAVFTDEPRILSNVIASQTELHARFGGVVPEVAARAHLQRRLPVIDEPLRKANVTLPEIGCIAVHNTRGS